MLTISDYLHQKASKEKVPLTGAFELSPVCNFSCRMCYVRKTPIQIEREGKKLIPWQRWLELAKQCKEEGMLYLLLTGGEPFLYPGFRELYTELHRMGFLLSVNTNGTMIDSDTVEWLSEMAPCRVNITLYGMSSETYERICGRPDGFERAMKAIHMLHQKKIPVVINASMIPENACDLEKICAFGKSLGVNTRVSTYMFPPMRRDKEERDSRFTPEESAEMYLCRAKCLSTEEQYKRFLSDTLSGIHNLSLHREDWGCDTEYMRCRAGRSTFWINWEGYMTACGMLDFPLKTEPFRSSFKECWMRLTNCVRTTPVLRACIGCKKRGVCNPCVAMIYGETGTVDKKASYLCEYADCVIKRMQTEFQGM